MPRRLLIGYGAFDEAMIVLSFFLQWGVKPETLKSGWISARITRTDLVARGPPLTRSPVKRDDEHGR